MSETLKIELSKITSAQLSELCAQKGLDTSKIVAVALNKLYQDEIASAKIYTIDEIRERIVPVAEKHRLKAVYLFGSYARGEATGNSDVDLLVDREGSDVNSLFELGGLYNDFCEALGKEVDIATVQTLKQNHTKKLSVYFIDSVRKEKVKLYG